VTASSILNWKWVHGQRKPGLCGNTFSSGTITVNVPRLRRRRDTQYTFMSGFTGLVVVGDFTQAAEHDGRSGLAGEPLHRLCRCNGAYYTIVRQYSMFWRAQQTSWATGPAIEFVNAVGSTRRSQLVRPRQRRLFSANSPSNLSKTLERQLHDQEPDSERARRGFQRGVNCAGQRRHADDQRRRYQCGVAQATRRSRPVALGASSRGSTPGQHLR